MKLEGGYEKIRIGRSGANQDKVNRFLSWVKAQGYIVWDIASDNRYEIDGISKKSQQEIQRYLESLGRTFKKPITRSGIMCMCDLPISLSKSSALWVNDRTDSLWFKTAK